METNDSGEKVINMDCECRSNLKSHCEGNLYIQPDKDKGRRNFYFNITDTRGADDATMWLSPDQVLHLIDELKVLVEEYK